MNRSNPAGMPAGKQETGGKGLGGRTVRHVYPWLDCFGAEISAAQDDWASQ